LFVSLRSRLALTSAGLSLVVLILLFGVCYATLEGFLEANAVATTRHNLQIVLDGLDAEVAQLRQVMSGLAVNSPIQAFLAAPGDEASDRAKKLAAFDVVRNSLYGSTRNLYINKLIIVDRWGRSIQTGSVPGHWSDAARAAQLAQHEADRLIVDPYEFGTHRPVIALTRPIFQDTTGAETAWVHVHLNTGVLTAALGRYSFEPDTVLYFVLGDQVLVLDDQRQFVPSAVSAATLVPGDTPVNLGQGSDRRLFVVYQAEGTGWTMAQSVPRAQLDQQNGVFLVLFLFVVMALGLLVVLLLVVVDRTVNQPIDRILGRLGALAQGRFGHDPTLEFRSELGDVGRGINALSKNIEDLIARRLDDERTKKNLEFKVLQNQINPHFLYNTLNSIKWMAEIQKSQGIAQMAGSLAVLLGHLAKGTDEVIPLGDELELVREYSIIQDYRTAGMVRLQVVLESPDLTRCPILKFTLQPLVENAIQHGIEPTGRPGNLVIHAHRDAEALVVDVTDDGVGIEAARLANLLQHEPSPRGRSFSPVGLKNVHERLRLHFGPEYGLSVRSQPGVYTTVSVRVPWPPQEAPCEPS